MAPHAGPKSIYKTNEDEWFASVLKEYLSLLEENPSDAATLKEKKTEDFLKEFETQLIDPNRKLELVPITDIGKWRTVSVSTAYHLWLFTHSG